MSVENLLPPHPLHRRIRLLRFFCGLNQAEMAEVLGANQSLLSRIEANKSEVTVSQLLAIRKKFGISVDQLLEGSIPYLEISMQFKRKLPVPERYAAPADSRVRALYAPILYLDSVFEDHALERIFQRMGFPVELLAEPRLPVSGRLFWDLALFSENKQIMLDDIAWDKIAAYALDSTSLATHLKTALPMASMGEAFEIFTRMNEERIPGFRVRPSTPIKNGNTLELEVTAELPTYRDVERQRRVVRYSRSFGRSLVSRVVAQVAPGLRVRLRRETSACFEELTSSSPKTLYEVKWS